MSSKKIVAALVVVLLSLVVGGSFAEAKSMKKVLPRKSKTAQKGDDLKLNSQGYRVLKRIMSNNPNVEDEVWVLISSKNVNDPDKVKQLAVTIAKNECKNSNCKVQLVDDKRVLDIQEEYLRLNDEKLMAKFSKKEVVKKIRNLYKKIPLLEVHHVATYHNSVSGDQPFTYHPSVGISAMLQGFIDANPKKLE